jgi:ABC-type nitrate/sulfonate/bicarbonate transport system ATPase subunit
LPNSFASLVLIAVIEQAASLPPNAPALSFVAVSKRFRQNNGWLEVLRNVSFDVPSGDIVAIVGSSGSGKTTLLNLAAGLIMPDSGRVLVMGQATDGVLDWSQLGYMFQDDRLLPWRVAVSNVALALEAGSMPSDDRLAQASSALDFVGLSEFANSYPHQLSGGMRSRVALARSLVTEPKILLMDEPFSRLDAQTRATMHSDLLRIHASRRMSILFVTHDVEEAVVLASRIVVFSPRPGRVHQVIDVALGQPRLDTPQTQALIKDLRATIAEIGST